MTEKNLMDSFDAATGSDNTVTFVAAKKEDGKTDCGPMTFLKMAGQGCISGQISEWPQLIPACKWAYEQISDHPAKLEAALEHERIQQAYADAHPGPIEFYDGEHGVKRTLVFEAGEPEVGISDGWVTEDDYRPIRETLYWRMKQVIDAYHVDRRRLKEALATAASNAKKSIEALHLAKKYLEDRGIRTKGTCGRHVVLPAIDKALEAHGVE